MARTKIAGNQSTGVLKLLALVLMFCDHAGKMIYGNQMDLRLLGRLAFPLYCWCVVVGADYTRSMPRYIGRLLLLGLISQPIYMVALNHGWSEPNVFFTLTLGLVSLWGLKEKKLLSQVWAPLLALAVAAYFKVDYGWKGILLMMLLWAVRDSRPGIAAVMVAFCLYWGTGTMTYSEFFGVPLNGLRKLPIQSLITPWLSMQSFAVFALPLMLIPMPGHLRLPKWVGYLLYPMHLLVLIVMEGQMLPNGWQTVLGRWTSLVWTPLMQLPSDLLNVVHDLTAVVFKTIA